jgi:predicted nucleic acid-binding Zn ribbon protein
MKCDKCGKESKILTRLVGFGLICSDCDAKLENKLNKKMATANKKLKSAGYTLVKPSEE